MAKMFDKQIYKSVKIAGKNSENQFLHFRLILTTVKGQLISADVFIKWWVFMMRMKSCFLM